MVALIHRKGFNKHLQKADYEALLSMLCSNPHSNCTLPTGKLRHRGRKFDSTHAVIKR
jgi:hypothetical protein